MRLMRSRRNSTSVPVMAEAFHLPPLTLPSISVLPRFQPHHWRFTKHGDLLVISSMHAPSWPALRSHHGSSSPSYRPGCAFSYPGTWMFLNLPLCFVVAPRMLRLTSLTPTSTSKSPFPPTESVLRRRLGDLVRMRGYHGEVRRSISRFQLRGSGPSSAQVAVCRLRWEFSHIDDPLLLALSNSGKKAAFIRCTSTTFVSKQRSVRRLHASCVASGSDASDSSIVDKHIEADRPEIGLHLVRCMLDASQIGGRG